MSLKDKVLAGAAYLDIILPGWHGRININTLDMSDPYHCICGMLGWGNFPFQESSWHAQHGFYWTNSYDDYETLDKLWKELIVGRREKEQLC